MSSTLGRNAIDKTLFPIIEYSFYVALTCILVGLSYKVAIFGNRGLIRAKVQIRINCFTLKTQDNSIIHVLILWVISFVKVENAFAYAISI